KPPINAGATPCAIWAYVSAVPSSRLFATISSRVHATSAYCKMALPSLPTGTSCRKMKRWCRSGKDIDQTTARQIAGKAGALRLWHAHYFSGRDRAALQLINQCLRDLLVGFEIRQRNLLRAQQGINIGAVDRIDHDVVLPLQR